MLPAMKYTQFLIAGVLWSLPCVAAEQIPWPEHPRPDMQRPAWVNLNGKWKFAFDPKDIGIKEGWPTDAASKLGREIVVPFPWESKLSGINDPKYKGVAWYAREIEIPAGKDWEGKDAWLIIGACDFETKVWINGKEAGTNIGGYLPVELNLAKFAKPGNRAQVVIRVVDTNDQLVHAQRRDLANGISRRPQFGPHRFLAGQAQYQGRRCWLSRHAQSDRQKANPVDHEP
jgi:Glycosyl hydrolases family 2, sugar binding domain